MKKKWAPDDYVKIMRNTTWTTKEKIEAWKSFCVDRGKAIGYDLNIKKLEKSVQDEFRGMGLEILGKHPIPAHHTSDPMLDLSVEVWQRFAKNIMHGDRAFCLAHSIKLEKRADKNKLWRKGLDDVTTEWLPCSEAGPRIGRTAKTIYHSWTMPNREPHLNAATDLQFCGVNRQEVRVQALRDLLDKLNKR